MKIISKNKHLFFTILFYTKSVERSDKIKIQIIGSNCSNGMKLKKILSRVIEQQETKIDIIESNDKKTKEKFHVSNIPGLVIDDQLISEGKVLTVREVEKIIKNSESFV